MMWQGLHVITRGCYACDVIKWKHFPRYWPFVRGIHRSPVNSPHEGQWHGALMFPLICASINGWVNNGEAGDLRRNRAHYDVTVFGQMTAWEQTGVSLSGNEQRQPSDKRGGIWKLVKVLVIIEIQVWLIIIKYKKQWQRSDYVEKWRVVLVQNSQASPRYWQGHHIVQ